MVPNRAKHHIVLFTRLMLNFLEYYCFLKTENKQTGKSIPTFAFHPTFLKLKTCLNFMLVLIFINTLIQYAYANRPVFWWCFVVLKRDFYKRFRRKQVVKVLARLLISIYHFFNYWFISFSDFSKFPFPKKKRVLEKTKYFNKKMFCFCYEVSFWLQDFWWYYRCSWYLFFSGKVLTLSVCNNRSH